MRCYAGQHMTRETFLSALKLTERLESLAWSRGIPRLLLLSGGEATEHPDVEARILSPESQ